MRTAGIDECGRGALAGPLVAACVEFPKDLDIPALIDDSKKMNPRKREEAFEWIQKHALHIGIAFIDSEEIDEKGLQHANMEAFRSAYIKSRSPCHLLRVDGMHAPDFGIPCETHVRGESLYAEIAAASIIAKVSRDRYMQEQDQLWPVYFFARNKGYGSAQHREAILSNGPCPLHRKTFCLSKKESKQQLLF